MTTAPLDDARLLASIPVRAEGTLLRREPFGAMLAGGEMKILNLNDDAAAIWDLIDGKRDVAAIERCLSARYADGTIRERLLEIMRFFISNGHLRLREG